MQLSAHPAPGIGEMPPGVRMTGRPSFMGVGDIIRTGGFTMPENYLMKSLAQVNGVPVTPTGCTTIDAWHRGDGMGDVEIFGTTLTTMNLVTYAAIAVVAIWGLSGWKKAARSSRLKISGTASPSEGVF